MKPAYNRLSRRQFLVGTGGALLPLPLLPSLLPREARAAATAQASSERYFVHMTTWHAVFQSQFFGPLLDLAPTQTQTYGGVAIRGAALASRTSGANTVISDILQAKSSALTPRMLSRMNVINGLDFAVGVGHNRGGPLGGDGSNPTIDQVLANASSFYPTKPLQPAIVRNLVSLSAAGTGTGQTQQTAESNVKLFDRLFKTSSAAAPAADQVVLVDRVKEHANLVMADASCSTDCKGRLSNYLDLLSDIESKLVTTVNSSFARPTVDTAAVEAGSGFYAQPDTQVQCEKLWNDIIVAAFAAGISRVYVGGPSSYTFGPESEGGWHNTYAHGLDDLNNRAVFSAAVQRQFEGAMLDIATKLDQVTTADGSTLFDKALVASGFEMGSGGNPGHHHNRCIPIATLGNAGGFFKTGLSVDYRDLTGYTWSSDPHWYSGLLYTQWMGMVLRAMGVTSADMTTTAWGYPNVRSPNGDHTDAIWNVAGQDLPWLKA
ncbi:MAG: DUF1552 domain-containing protein [Burkholderiales bacterium]